MSGGRLRAFWKAKRWLRENFPTRCPVRIYLRPIKGDMGLCNFDCETERFVVSISSDLNLNETLETLCHEWAHVLREHIPEGPHDHDDGHDPIFDAILGCINRAWHRDTPEGNVP